MEQWTNFQTYKMATIDCWTWKMLHLGSALALLTNDRLGWKSLPGENSLACYEDLSIKA
jgi:hypothetical protein